MIQVWLTVLMMALLAGGCQRADAPLSGTRAPELEVVRISPVNTPYPLEPSGLTLHAGALFTVADKVNDTLFKVEWDGGGEARLVPHLRFKGLGGGAMDWEGITVDKTGTFFLISESRGRLARVESTGDASWASVDLRTPGREAGLFQKRNAAFEGIARLGPNHWLGAVEREPRGLVEWTDAGMEGEVMAWQMMQSPFKGALSLLRIPDYSGLHFDATQGVLYALFRNAHLVVRLEKREGRWAETQAWSYRHIETDPRWAFMAQTYGQAEGLVVEGQTVYLIFDNNLGGRQSDRSDTRPLIVEARMPAP